MSNVVKVLVDSDVMIHLYKGDKLTLLHELFKGRVVILDRVVTELAAGKSSSMISAVENLLRFKMIEVMTFPDEGRIRLEYAKLEDKMLGKGESACMAVCRFYPHLIASCNIRDIDEYCTEHQIAYITTMDILCIALERNVMSSAECNEFINKVKKQGSNLPDMSIEEFRDTKFDRSKLSY